MHSARLSLIAVALPAVAAGLLVLAIGGVGRTVWLINLLALVLACALAVFGRLPRQPARRRQALYALCALTLAGLAAPLLGDGATPERWLRLGPFTLYVAPLLLPSFLGACSALRRDVGGNFGLAALVGAGLLLAAQPDASQVLALLAAALVLCSVGRGNGGRAWAAVPALALAAAWAALQPDPLEPVPYVEGVFALTLGHSIAMGVAVIAAGIVLLVGLARWANRHGRWVLAVSAYYAGLFACSVAGLTPAPLIGFGAGPLLGYGLLVAVASGLDGGVPA